MSKKTILIYLCSAAMVLSGCASNAPQTAPGPTPQPDVPAKVSVPASALAQAENVLSALLSTISISAQAAEALDMSFPQTFAITRPDKAISTAYATYFITGTSDPDEPVFYGDTEITRQGTKGLFGVQVPLNLGKNTFTFRQGDKATTVTITRKSETASPITDIVQGSMFPSNTGGARAGGVLSAECSAPSGASVTAAFGGQRITLTQVTKASAGLPATFRGEFAVGTDYPAGETTNQGKITYAMTYNGSSKSYKSTGDVFIAGENSRLALEVSGYIGLVYQDPGVLSVFREKLKGGGLDYVVSQSGSHYKLASGGYLPNASGRILEGAVNIKNRLNEIYSEDSSKSESYIFEGTKTPVFLTTIGEGTFSITLFNTEGTPGADVSGSRLFGRVSAAQNDGSITYTFHQKVVGNLWGYNVSYDGDNTVLRFAYKPHLSSGSTPLSGVNIVLDPGHGKEDSGALGVPGKTGPDENTINLAHALAAKKILEEQGARVYMTRSAVDGFLTLDERLEFFENSRADIFVSIHHNSLAESADANTVSGMEIYYHNRLARNFSNRLMEGLAANLNRINRTVAQSYYRVTIIPFAPSLLCELGYLSNPLEYERITNPDQLQKTANALVEGIKHALA